MKKKALVALALAVCAVSPLAQTPLAPPPTPMPGMVRLDPAFDRIVAKNAKVEILKQDYFGLSEGPLWWQDGSNGYLLFADIPANVIYKWTPDGKLSVFMDKSGFSGANAAPLGYENYLAFNGRLNVAVIGSNGMARDPQGRLIFVTQGDRNVVRIEPDGKRTVLADKYDGKRFNRPNDMALKKDGAIYFTDPRANSPTMEQPGPGVYLIKDGNVTLLLKDYMLPNGIALSPDERTLYVNDLQRRLIMRYDVQADDTIANGRTFIDMSSDKAPGAPDGMKVDPQGNVFCTGPGGIWVMSPDGKHLGTIGGFPENVTNMAFGDADGKTLYITDRRSLARIRLTGPQAPAPPMVATNVAPPAAHPIVRLDPALDAILASDARLEILKADYFGISEGPVWLRDGSRGSVIFSDIIANVIYKWTPDNKMSVFLDKAGYSGDLPSAGRQGFFGQTGHLWIANFGSNGITIDPEGRVVFTAQGDRAIVRLEKDGTRTVLADKFEGKRLNRPNDLVIKSDGAVYFTDPYAMNNATLELKQAAVYRVKDGKVDVMDKNIPVNGLAFSPDEKFFYIAAGGQLNQYDVMPDGTIANRRLLVDFTVDKAPGGPDGMKVDTKGNLYSTGPGGVWIISPQGKHLGTILLPETATNLAFADADAKTLYITDRRTLARIRLKTPGIIPGPKAPAGARTN